MIKTTILIMASIIWGQTSDTGSLGYLGEREITTSLKHTEPALLNDTISLEAKNGKGIGPRIKYMPEWEAFGWFNESDRIEWDVEVTTAGIYDVYLEWSAEGGVVGNPYVLKAGKSSIKSKVETTGSWEVFKEKQIGEIKLKKGKVKLIIRPDKKVKKGGYFDVRKLTLILQD